MNKAFTREPDATGEYCPRCGSKGESVAHETLAGHVPADRLAGIAVPANFCPSASCAVAYFDGFERTILASELIEPVYPKDPNAPVCACFGLTRDDIELDVREGGVRRTKAALEKAKSPEAQCGKRAANGRSCVGWVQKTTWQLCAARSLAPHRSCSDGG